MSTSPPAVSAPAPRTDLAGLGVTPVPDVWPPAGGPLAPGDRQALADLAAPGGDKPATPACAQPSQPSWPRQFAVLLAETLAGVRPARQILPWMSERGSVQLHRLLPLLRDERRPRVLRVLTTAPSADVIEMTVVVLTGTRARALAVRLERSDGERRRPAHAKQAPGWRCTDIEAG